MAHPDLEGGNVLTPEVLGYAADLYDAVLDITFGYTAADTDEERTGFKYADDGDDDPNDFICVKTGPDSCFFQSLLVFFESGEANGVGCGLDVQA